jgi:dihydropteroate synthase
MHAQGGPKTMQADPRYDNVLLDVYDFLAERLATSLAAGISRDRIIVDPGIGFGKTVHHNLALLQGLSLFHGLGCVVLLGASRKRFIGEIGQEPVAENRVGGSISVTLQGISQGVQISRVHDIEATRQAMSLQQAIGGASYA